MEGFLFGISAGGACDGGGLVLSARGILEMVRSLVILLSVVMGTWLRRRCHS